MIKGTLLASAKTLEGVRAMIVQYFAGSTVTLTKQPDGSLPDPWWTVSTGKGLVTSVMVRLARGRYRFERVIQGGGSQ